MLALTLVLVGGFPGGWGCAPDGPGPVLSAVSSTPAEGVSWPADAPLRVRFDGWLAPDSLNADGVSLRSGEIEFGFSLAYDPVDRSLLVIPPVDLRVGLAYALTVSPDAVRGLDGRPLVDPLEVGFIAGPPEGARVASAPVAFERLTAIFDQQCGCHGPEPLAWPPLTPEGLVGVRSRRAPERRLVVPGQPLESELVLALLTDYPGVGAPMPLGGPPLAADRVRTVIAWVEGLAR